MDMSTAEYFKNIDSKEGLFLWMTMLISFFLGFLIAYLLRSAKVRRLKREAREHEEQQKSLQAQLLSAQTQLTERNAELQEESRERVDLMDRMSQLEQQKQQHLTEVFQLNQQIEELQLSNRQHLSSIDDLNEQLLVVNTQSEQPVQFADGSTDNVTAAASSEEMAQMNSRLSEFETILGQISTENTQLKQDLNSLKNESNTRQVVDVNIAEEPTPQVHTDKTVLYEKILVSDRQHDDLTKIDGLGDFLADKLYSIGVFTYQDIAEWTSERVEQVTEEIGYLPGRIEKDQWVQQATLLSKGEVPQAKAKSTKPGKKAKGPKQTDLKIIEGIGPKIEKVLKTAGVNTWENLAATEPGRLKEILEEAGDRFRMHNPYTWPLQARLAAAGRWDEFNQYQDELKGGK